MILEPIVYGISPYASNAMMSDNPHSGIYEAKTARTLDLNGGNPACNQGGMIVLEGNGARPSHQGDGYAESETMYTLNTIERHGVCYTVDQGGGKSQVSISKDISPTLTTTHDGAPAVCYWDGGQVAGTLTAQNSGGVRECRTKETSHVSSYQKVTGPLMANSHPGSYCGQDVYQDMLIVEELK